MAKKQKKKKAAKKASALMKISVANCMVVPGAPTVSKGDEVQWENNTTRRIILFFPHDQVLGPSTPNNHFLEVIGAGKQHKLKTHKTGAFRYAIYCEDGDCFAEGSDPEIIVV